MSLIANNNSILAPKNLDFQNYNFGVKIQIFYKRVLSKIRKILLRFGAEIHIKNEKYLNFSAKN